MSINTAQSAPGRGTNGHSKIGGRQPGLGCETRNVCTVQLLHGKGSYHPFHGSQANKGYDPFSRASLHIMTRQRGETMGRRRGGNVQPSGQRPPQARSHRWLITLGVVMLGGLTFFASRALSRSWGAARLPARPPAAAQPTAIGQHLRARDTAARSDPGRPTPSAPSVSPITPTCSIPRRSNATCWSRVSTGPIGGGGTIAR